MTAPSATPRSLHGGTADGLVGREPESDEAYGLLRRPGGPRLVLVRGERGAGRTAFLHAVGERLRAEGTAVLALDCVPGDDERPLLLALRLVMALERHRPTGAPTPRRPGAPTTEALRAAEQGDATAMAGLLRTALAYPVTAPVVVVVDDIQHADADSLAVLAVLAGTDPAHVPPGARLLASAVGHGEQPGQPKRPERPVDRRMTRLAGARGARTLVLSPLGPDGTTALVARRLRATPDTGLARRVRELTLGVPGAVDALLTGWTRDGAIRVADSHAFVEVRTPPPVLRDDDRFVTALDALSGPCRTVAGALSILWPLGGRAAELIAASTGLSADAVGDALRDLTDAEVVEDLPGPGGPPAPGAATAPAGPGRRFRLPLTAHAVRERLGPLERARLSATAVEALWADRDTTDTTGTATPASPPALALTLTSALTPALPDEADAVAYLADRIAEAGPLVDPDRAVAELTAAAQRLHPDSAGGGVLRWRRAVCHLSERPADRVAALGRYATAAYDAGDHRTARSITESVLRDLADVLDPAALQETASLFTAATADDLDRRALSRLATARWWEGLRLPAVVAVTGRALALSHLERWHEVLDLLSRTEPVWAGDPRVRAKPGYFRAVAELALGRPERFREALALPEAPELEPGHVHALATAMFDELLSGRDLRAAEALLAAQGLTPDMLPPRSLFLRHHLGGRWDEALEPARRMLANNRTGTPAADRCLIPARTAEILLARGRTTSARRVVDGVRGRAEGPLEYSLDAVEAAILRTLGDPVGAVRTLLGGIGAADARGQVAGTDELWAALAEVHAEEGRAGEAAACLRRLERISDRTGSGRTRLRYLLASARVLQQDAPDATRAARTVRDNLREAVELARSRSQPFETAQTLVAAAGAGAGPPELLHEAYALFGTVGAALWRFRTRTAMREAGLTVPGRRRATAENEHLLATLIAEGLTNRRIATVLGLSEDAVANRLTRLFTRTGLRSRTEVVTAVLTHYRAHGIA
ncbi:LuxR family transcriptional regulator [Streptomyces beigongshangae]|uniref:LuxR family transcriptional regulator n=1 Tax=Streptomyces beigongshangae TaxID=2841597 RepID=UPI001C84209B|nr:LuxR family transcriptional regulator [Streptomyces sp. REN17]